VPECWEEGVSFAAHPSCRILTNTCNPHCRETPRTEELRPRRELIAFPTVEPIPARTACTRRRQSRAYPVKPSRAKSQVFWSRRIGGPRSLRPLPQKMGGSVVDTGGREIIDSRVNPSDFARGFRGFGAGLGIAAVESYPALRWSAPGQWVARVAVV
jgi:hypothetical protein